MADELIHRFGSLPRVLLASRESLLCHGDEIAGAIGVIQVLLEHALRWRMLDADTATDSASVIDYLTFAQGHLTVERVSALFLDARHRILTTEIVAIGTVDAATVHIRGIIGRAIELGAVGIIIAHNHPSGHTQPSRADIDLTRRIIRVASGCDIAIIDHLII